MIPGKGTGTGTGLATIGPIIDLGFHIFFVPRSWLQNFVSHTIEVVGR